MPALLTTMSTRPNASIAHCTMRWADSHSATLSVLIAARPPRWSMICRVCSAGLPDRPSPVSDAPTSLITTAAPASAMATAISRPMPPPAPVTIATLPSSIFPSSPLVLGQPSPNRAGSVQGALQRLQPGRKSSRGRSPMRNRSLGSGSSSDRNTLAGSSSTPAVSATSVTKASIPPGPL